MSFNFYSHYYDLLYQDKDYHSEAAYIDSLLKKYAISQSNILEFGSGTGIHAGYLCELGYLVHGVELSSEMVARSKHSPGFVLQQGDIRSIQLGRKFGTVLSLFHVLSYQVTNDDVLSVFARASDHLDSGGPLFLTFGTVPPFIR